MSATTDRLREAARLFEACETVRAVEIIDVHDELKLTVEIPNPGWGLPSDIHSVLKAHRHLELRDFQGNGTGPMRLWVVVHGDGER